MSKKRILTGDRPTGRLHIGHYFGSLKKRLELQENEEYDPYILIADVQALTDNFNNPEKVRKNVREVAIDYLSIGIDPKKTTIYIQSMIPEVAELTVFYSNLVTIARLERNPTVKTEIAQKREIFGESVTYGFLGYPVSQAADITAFHASLIPVGEDQLPLIEQCREIVRKFNSIYGDVLVEPEAILSETKRIKGLDGNEKMGKSLGNAIYISDSEEEITRKVMSAVTDPNRIKKTDLGNPDICMVAYYHNLFTDKNECEKICEECRALTEYALFRLEKCPFKANKKFCSFCKIHCYKPDMREKIKDVMKWAGPRMIFTHPVFAFRHVFQMIKYKKKLKKEEKAKGNV